MALVDPDTGKRYLPGYTPMPVAPAAVPPPPSVAPSPVAQQLANNPFETDPGYLAALAAEQAGIQQADNALRAAQEQAIVGFGDPGLAKALGIDISAQTSQAAQANPYSTTRRLAQSRDDRQQALVNNLAAHGIIRSGALGYQTGRNEQQYGQELYDAQQQVLGGLGDLNRQTVAQKQSLRAGTTGALSAAYDRYVSNPQFYGAADPAAASAQVEQPAAPIAQAMAPRPDSILAPPRVRSRGDRPRTVTGGF